MKFKKFLTLGMATILTSSMLVGCGNSDEPTTEDQGTTSEESVMKIGMITDTGGINDESFNQITWKGLQDVQEEVGSDKLEIKYLESSQDSDFIPNIETFVDEELDLIIGVGFKIENAIQESAENFPEQKFAMIDGVVDAENVVSLLFNDNESSYLVGLIAGKMTETDKVGFIGGMVGEVVERFRWGFRAGVEAANPDVVFVDQYADSFVDVAKGKTIATQMYNDGADVILSAAGAVGIGVIESAKENDKKTIGVDLDQNHLAPDNIISSATKNIDVAISSVVRDLVNGTFQGGETVMGTLANNGVGIAATTDKNVQPDVIEFVNQEAEKIKSGEITVPKTEEEYNELNQ